MILTAFTTVYAMNRITKIQTGHPAPDFTAIDENGDTLRLSEYFGEYIVVYFFPKAFTPG